MKESFYKETDMTFENQLIFRKESFSLKQSYIEKKIFINKYDKKKFIQNKKSTEPTWIANFQTSDK